MEHKLDLKQMLNHYVDPSKLNYQEWINVGMALKYEGYTATDWDEWSQKDAARYHPVDCFKKWDTFNGAGTPVTGGTIVQLAKEQGWAPAYYEEDHELDWDGVISREPDDYVIIDKGWIEGSEIEEPKNWNPLQDLITYLETLFDSTENVGYVTQSWEKDGKYMPSKGNYDRTAGQLIQELTKCNGDIGAVLGDYNPEVGAWIRFNPLDGKGVKNENVTDFRFALVESDSMEIEKQYAILKELELPIACLVHSGKKSVHAIVKVDAATYEEYRKRVDYLYTICKKNGLDIDTQNKNPSRLSRMPGVMRKGHKQFLIDTNIGKANWAEWKEWIESVNDDLPEPERLEDFWNDLPDLAEPLIDGVLRQGHKMLIAGPSKAGKSFALIELCIAIAEGKQWFNWNCTKGKVMYVNLELDRASCLHRFKDVYEALGWMPKGLQNIDIWNLRGKSIPMDKLAPKLIRRASKKSYIAIIIDPIYKVITGDENSADQMAAFCNQFDKICTELGTAVIYCHHHSKGQQGNKRSMDRASGSGVFARDPDALLDLIELETNASLMKQETNKEVCRVCMEWLKRYGKESEVSQDDALSETNMLVTCKMHLKEHYDAILEDVDAARKRIASSTAWRIEGTLREFPKFAPINLWFDYPIHRVDRVGSLGDINPEDQKPLNQRGTQARQKQAKSQRVFLNAELDNAYNALLIDGKVTIKALAEYWEMGVNGVKKRIDTHPDYSRKNGIVYRNKESVTDITDLD